MQFLPEISPQQRPKRVAEATLEHWLLACRGSDNSQETPSESLSLIDHLYVVTRPNDALAIFLKDWLAARAEAPCTLLTSTEAALGMGHSLAQAAGRIPQGTLIVGLADMPFIRPDTIGQIARSLRTSPDTVIVQPACEGKPGNPLGFGAAHRKALSATSGDEGARSLVKRARSDGMLKLIEVADDGVIRDIDEPRDISGR